MTAPAGGGWQLRLLGGFELRPPGEPAAGAPAAIRLPTRAVGALLARLAMSPGRAHSREELAELLWPGTSAAVARNRLRQALSVLRSLLESSGVGPAVLADRLTVQLLPGVLVCDASAFEHAVRGGRHAEAAALYRGELMPGFHDEWIAVERLRLAGVHDRLAPPPIAAAPPVAGTGLPAYLTRRVGGEGPLHALRGALSQHRLVTLLGPGGSGKTRLAVEFASMCQRLPPEGETARVEGVVFVSMLACSTRAQALDALMARLGGGQGSGQHSGQGDAAVERAIGRIADALGGRRVLLVLDNFEQLVGHAEGLVAQLLSALPGLHVLVTSRRALGLDGEREFVVEPLGLPPASPEAARHAGVPASPAEALFADRARAVRSGFVLEGAARVAVAGIVRALEGMPLAIELAASRVRSFTPAELLAALRPASGAGTPTLDLLTREPAGGGAEARHRSMLRTIEWSWQQLTAAQRALLGAMSVFRAGCTAAALHALRHEAGAAVAPAATRAMLGALQAQSLVQSREEADGSLRFSLFEPIREYAAAQQDAAATRHWRARQRAWALGWAQALPATPPLAEVRTELPNLRAALASAVADGTPDDAVLLLLALQPALEEIGLPSEPLHDAQQAVEACRDHVLRSRGRSALSGLLFTAGEREAALRQARAGLDSVPAEPAMRARALHALGRLAWRSERRADLAEPLLQEALSAAQQAGDLEVQASSLALLGFMQAAPPTADVDGARTLHRRALALWEAAGNQHTINGGRYNLAACDLFMRRFDTALEQLSEVARSSREQQDWLCLSGALDGIGTAMVGLRRWHEALAVQRQAIEAAWPSMSMYDLAFGLWNTPRSLAHVREPEAAWRVLGFAVPFWQARVGALDAADQHYLRLVGRLVGLQVDAARMERLWAEGRRLTLLQAITLALGHAPSGAAL